MRFSLWIISALIGMACGFAFIIVRHWHRSQCTYIGGRDGSPPACWSHGLVKSKCCSTVTCVCYGFTKIVTLHLVAFVFSTSPSYLLCFSYPSLHSAYPRFLPPLPSPPSSPPSKPCREVSDSAGANGTASPSSLSDISSIASLHITQKNFAGRFAVPAADFTTELV